MKKGQYLIWSPFRISERLRGLFDLLRSTRAEYQRDQARYFAVAMVYYAFISLEPMLFLVVASLGLMLHSPRFAGERCHGRFVQNVTVGAAGAWTPLPR